MIKGRFSYETADELADLMHLLVPLVKPGSRTAEKEGGYNRLYVTFDPERLAKMGGTIYPRPNSPKD